MAKVQWEGMGLVSNPSWPEAFPAAAVPTLGEGEDLPENCVVIEYGRANGLCEAGIPEWRESYTQELIREFKIRGISSRLHRLEKDGDINRVVVKKGKKVMWEGKLLDLQHIGSDMVTPAMKEATLTVSKAMGMGWTGTGF